MGAKFFNRWCFSSACARRIFTFYLLILLLYIHPFFRRNSLIFPVFPAAQSSLQSFWEASKLSRLKVEDITPSLHEATGSMHTRPSTSPCVPICVIKERRRDLRILWTFTSSSNGILVRDCVRKGRNMLAERSEPAAYQFFRRCLSSSSSTVSSFPSAPSSRSPSQFPAILPPTLQTSSSPSFTPLSPPSLISSNTRFLNFALSAPNFSCLTTAAFSNPIQYVPIRRKDFSARTHSSHLHIHRDASRLCPRASCRPYVELQAPPLLYAFNEGVSLRIYPSSVCESYPHLLRRSYCFLPPFSKRGEGDFGLNSHGKPIASLGGSNARNSSFVERRNSSSSWKTAEQPSLLFSYLFPPPLQQHHHHHLRHLHRYHHHIHLSAHHHHHLPPFPTPLPPQPPPHLGSCRFSNIFPRPLLKSEIGSRQADCVANRLLIRAAMIHQVGSGVFAWLPLGLRVLRKVEALIRREMEGLGALEVSLPAIQPKALWEISGRLHTFSEELFTVSNRNTHLSYCLAPTHEELITKMMKTFIKSYRQLPVMLYQIQSKYRNELRPRYGLSRLKEFFMKDAYSFHTDEESLSLTYEEVKRAYRKLLKTLKLWCVEVEADGSSMMGGSSVEFQVISRIGESFVSFPEVAADGRLQSPPNTQTHAKTSTEDMLLPSLHTSRIELLGKGINLRVSTRLLAGNKPFEQEFSMEKSPAGGGVCTPHEGELNVVYVGCFASDFEAEKEKEAAHKRKLEKLHPFDKSGATDVKAYEGENVEGKPLKEGFGAYEGAGLLCVSAILLRITDDFDVEKLTHIFAESVPNYQLKVRKLSSSEVSSLGLLPSDGFTLLPSNFDELSKRFKFKFIADPSLFSLEDFSLINKNIRFKQLKLEDIFGGAFTRKLREAVALERRASHVHEIESLEGNGGSGWGRDIPLDREHPPAAKEQRLGVSPHQLHHSLNEGKSQISRKKTSSARFGRQKAQGLAESSANTEPAASPNTRNKSAAPFKTPSSAAQEPSIWRGDSSEYTSSNSVLHTHTHSINTCEKNPSSSLSSDSEESLEGGEHMNLHHLQGGMQKEESRPIAPFIASAAALGASTMRRTREEERTGGEGGSVGGEGEREREDKEEETGEAETGEAETIEHEEEYSLEDKEEPTKISRESEKVVLAAPSLLQKRAKISALLPLFRESSLQRSNTQSSSHHHFEEGSNEEEASNELNLIVASVSKAEARTHMHSQQPGLRAALAPLVVEANLPAQRELKLAIPDSTHVGSNGERTPVRPCRPEYPTVTHTIYRTAEIGHIFKLGTHFSKAFNLTFSPGPQASGKGEPQRLGVCETGSDGVCETNYGGGVCGANSRDGMHHASSSANVDEARFITSKSEKSAFEEANLPSKEAYLPSSTHLGVNTPLCVRMGCYGIGLSRLIATLVDNHHDERGLCLPSSVSPFYVGIAILGGRGGEEGGGSSLSHAARDKLLRGFAKTLYNYLDRLGYDTLLDDRPNIRLGVTLHDFDLIGIPHRIIVTWEGLSNVLDGVGQGDGEEAKDIISEGGGGRGSDTSREGGSEGGGKATEGGDKQSTTQKRGGGMIRSSNFLWEKAYETACAEYKYRLSKKDEGKRKMISVKSLVELLRDGSIELEE